MTLEFVAAKISKTIGLLIVCRGDSGAVEAAGEEEEDGEDEDDCQCPGVDEVGEGGSGRDACQRSCQECLRAVGDQALDDA